MKQKELRLAVNVNCIILSVTFFAVLTTMVMYLPNMREIDYSILKAVRDFLAPYPNAIPEFVSNFGIKDFLMWPLIAACGILISHSKYLKAFMLVLFTELTFFLKDFLKDFVARERPFDYPTSFSFPSGHCSTEMCFLGILIYLVNRYCSNKFWRYFLTGTFSIWMLLLAVSRLWLGAHFLTDVLAGIFLGLFMANVFIILDKCLNSR